MKFLTPQITYLLTQRETRRNLQALLRYLGFLAAVVVTFSILFHFLMAREGQDHSWITGFYWTLTVMSTLGFGDITFTSDLGRGFSMLVLLSGIVLLLIVLPFAFIRFFYAPWLEAQIRLRAPRRVPRETSGHLVMAAWDPVARGLARKLAPLGIPYFVLEPDSHRAAALHAEGVSVMTGDFDAVATYGAARVEQALGVLANLSDAENTSLTLTVREHAPDAPVIAIAEEDDSVDILELAGATHVLPLKHRLGEHLAGRVNAGHAQAHRVGRYQDLEIAEFPVHNTPLSGKAIRDTRLREVLGVNIVGVWERGRLLPAEPDHVLTDASVPVVIGTPEQIQELDALLVIYDVNFSPLVVIGGGKVGTAAVRALRDRGLIVHLVERDERLSGRLEGVADRLILGDAADRKVLMEAGLAEAPSVLLTTNDDATNIYLAVYCRRLNPELRIVSRITHERNVEAIHRAGADFVLSYAFLGVESVFSILQGRELILLGQGLEFFALEIPRSLVGKSLAQAQVRARTGLNVVAVQTEGKTQPGPLPGQPLSAAGRLLAVGTREQRERFRDAFGT
ncbi:MAG TPA: NAD-binding protein [Thermoanaerobaculia bacterium]|nr:NAD-binding protein [Thermoanaerobaculia bacterium]